jgi:hypothetical protein
MTLRPALARFERGFRRMGSWTLARVTGARGYRFEGEQEAHAELARETTISLGLMAGASPDDPDQVRMASEIEHGAENRLTVLLGKARLTMEEKGERDAIQAAISARRQGFVAAPVTAPRRFLGPLAAQPVLAILLSPYTWLVALGAFCVLQMGLKERVENQRDDARRELTQARESMEALVSLNDRLQSDINNANRSAAQTADTIEAERARRLEAERVARRIRNEMERARAGAGAVDYGFGGVRDPGAGGTTAPGGSDPASDRPG